MDPNNSEFNKAMAAIIKKAIGKSICDEIEAGEITNLPANFEIVDDYEKEVYSIKGSISNPK